MILMKTNVCHIISDGRILLKKASRGIGKGKWNGPGGKMEEGETPEESVKREVFEETGLKVTTLFYHGMINFHAKGKRIVYNNYVFSTSTFKGRPRSTEEGVVRWFKTDSIPYDKMWADDIVWLHLMLDGRRFDGDFYYDGRYSKLLHCEIRFK